MSTTATMRPIQPGATALVALASRYREVSRKLLTETQVRTAAARNQAADLVASQERALAAEEPVIRRSLRAFRASVASLSLLDFDQLGKSASRLMTQPGRALLDAGSMVLRLRAAPVEQRQKPARLVAAQPGDANSAPLPSLTPSHRAARR